MANLSNLIAPSGVLTPDNLADQSETIAGLVPAPDALTETQVTDDTSTVSGTVSGQRLSQAVDAFSGGGIGEDQAWQNVSRSANTSYQNTTGKPIMVAVRGASRGYVEVSQNGSAWVRVGKLGEPGAWEESVSFIVPNNHYYRARGSFNIWAELR